MRIVFMGTPDFAVATLDALTAAGHEICLVVTQPDRPRGRHGEPAMSPIKEAAIRKGIPVLCPERIREDSAAKERLRELCPELIVVTAFGQILPKEILELPKYGCINVHASLLPKYRGAAPIQWAILMGDSVTGVSTMQMAEGLDTGDILLQELLPLSREETGESLFEKLAPLGGKLIVKTIEALEQGSLQAGKQDEEHASLVTVFQKNSGLINWNMDSIRLERMVRGLYSWPCAFTVLDGKKARILKAAAVPDLPEGFSRAGAADEAAIAGIAKEQIEKIHRLKEKERGLPRLRLEAEEAEAYLFRDNVGELYSDGRRLLVKTGAGYLEILSLQMEGKKRMETEAFLRGCRFLKLSGGDTEKGNHV